MFSLPSMAVVRPAMGAQPALLRIKFDDHSFLDRQVDVFALGEAQNPPRHACRIQFEPMRRSTSAAIVLESARSLNWMTTDENPWPEVLEIVSM